MSKKLDTKGDIVETQIFKITRYEFLNKLADEKIEFLDWKKEQLAYINKLQLEIGEIDAQITADYNVIIPDMKATEKKKIADTMHDLNNKLAIAFPSDFKAKPKTVVAK